MLSILSLTQNVFNCWGTGERDPNTQRSRAQHPPDQEPRVAHLRLLLIIIKAPGLTVPIDGQCGSSCGGGPKCHWVLTASNRRGSSGDGSEKKTLGLHHQLLLPHHQPQQEQCSAPSQPTRNPWTPKSFGKDFLNAIVSSRGANCIRQSRGQDEVTATRFNPPTLTHEKT